ncbi:hypothetical protein [Burkholderia ubonensis]|uniref:hypothetical protein n=1 Tax=Burkholderia ubonensis TaxID=101571 RepID=UPI001E3F3D78|nr:hypothetical protein [Burkholderia ubonensis]
MITSIQNSHIYRFEFLKYAPEQFNQPKIPIRRFSIFNILTHRLQKPIDSFNGVLQIRALRIRRLMFRNSRAGRCTFRVAPLPGPAGPPALAPCSTASPGFLKADHID